MCQLGTIACIGDMVVVVKASAASCRRSPLVNQYICTYLR